ncbi:uncharacterized protein BDW43DRAFT_16370 [Aspergillus alliaceus]|uniref:uncharacterized protein n=1 Tax=Petromyces alliaceus TaxID=209559 RepID=UPI0012A6821D|nr:uncharacterized protein BDW43DRAFT_16370 [Aspergillus alliaceus]KAB8235953.1 hypothetical protein BDW43DRAFT_16370 [Aspergillus alliaceus]
MVDVVARLIRCQIDPGMSAAAFVLVSSLTIVGPLTRLSWQEDGADMAVEPVFYPVTVKEWTWKTMRFLCHTVVYAILFEPYINTRLMLAIYILLSITLFYSGVRGEGLLRTSPYWIAVYRPRGERVVAFCIIQIIFNSVLFSFYHSIWPQTDAIFFELDQIAGLFLAMATLVYSRRERIVTSLKWVKGLKWKRTSTPQPETTK